MNGRYVIPNDLFSLYYYFSRYFHDTGRTGGFPFGMDHGRGAVVYSLDGNGGDEAREGGGTAHAASFSLQKALLGCSRKGGCFVHKALDWYIRCPVRQNLVFGSYYILSHIQPDSIVNVALDASQSKMSGGDLLA